MRLAKYIILILSTTFISCNRKDFYQPKIDKSINRDIPSIVLNGSNSIDIALGGVYNELGAIATDVDGNSLAVVTQTNINLNLTGNYSVTYTATDQYGKQNSITRSVNIIMDITNWLGSWSVNHNCRTSTFINLLKDPANITNFSTFLTIDHDGRITSGNVTGQDIVISSSIITILITSNYEFTGTGRISDDGNTIVINYDYVGLNGLAGNGSCSATYTKQTP
jgi:hypothetical protein